MHTPDGWSSDDSNSNFKMSNCQLLKRKKKTTKTQKVGSKDNHVIENLILILIY